MAPSKKKETTIISGGIKILDLIQTDQSSEVKLELLIQPTKAFVSQPVVKTSSLPLPVIPQIMDSSTLIVWEAYKYRKEWVNVNPRNDPNKTVGGFDAVHSQGGPWTRAICFANKPAEMYVPRDADFPDKDTAWDSADNFDFKDPNQKEWTDIVKLNEPEVAVSPGAQFCWDKHDDEWIGNQYVKHSTCLTEGSPVIQTIESANRVWHPIKTDVDGPGVLAFKNKLYLHSLDFINSNRTLFEDTAKWRGENKYAVPACYIEVVARQRKVDLTTHYKMNLFKQSEEDPDIKGNINIKEVEITNQNPNAKAMLSAAAA